jgi:carbonic anhydrase
MPRTFAPDALPPEEALARLREGNRRFVLGDGSALRRWHPGLTDQPSPFAVVLGCADSRAPAEYVFDQDLGDLFVIRVAGNIVAPSLVGSVEFAASEFGTRLVVVMGHTQCGAVAATMNALTLGGGPASRESRTEASAPRCEPTQSLRPESSGTRARHCKIWSIGVAWRSCPPCTIWRPAW